MAPAPDRRAGPDLALFRHPQGVYTLHYPASWETIVREEGRSCGFGPRKRDDVGLWISILPFRVNTEAAEFRSTLRGMLEQGAGGSPLAGIREDPSLQHHALKADSATPGEAGHHWLVAAGDLLLLASSEVPAGAREEFEGPFDAVMASLRVERQEELQGLQTASDLLARLRSRFPAQDYRLEREDIGGWAIRGGDQVIYAASLIRRVRESPAERDRLMEDFIRGLACVGDDAPSIEVLEAVRERILPVLKPEEYVRAGGPAATAVHRSWRGGLITCYAVEGDRTLRFILEKDLRGWQIPLQELHRIALENLERRPFPESFSSPGPPIDRLVLFNTGDAGEASRLLHPRLHATLAPVLGTPFLAGIPDRGSLVLFSRERAATAAKVAATIREDHRRAAYPISPRIFMVEQEGIRLAENL